MGNTQKTPQLTIKTLSTLSGVSEPSIVRFCRRVGARGYADFKLKLTESLASGRFSQPKNLDSESTTLQLKTAVIDIQKNALTELQDELSDEAIEYALYHLKQAKRLFLLGIGQNQSTADEMYESLWTIKPSTFLCRDIQSALNQALEAHHDDVLVLLGSAPQSLALLQSAHTRGMKILAFCDPESPLAEHFDAIIPINLHPNNRRIQTLCEQTKVRGAVQLLIQALELDLAGKLQKRLDQKKKRPTRQNTSPAQSSLW